MHLSVTTGPATDSYEDVDTFLRHYAMPDRLASQVQFFTASGWLFFFHESEPRQVTLTVIAPTTSDLNHVFLPVEEWRRRNVERERARAAAPQVTVTEIDSEALAEVLAPALEPPKPNRVTRLWRIVNTNLMSQVLGGIIAAIIIALAGWVLKAIL